MTQSPLQEAIRIIDSYLVKKPLDDDFQIGKERAYNEAIVVLQSLLPKEKEFVGNVWDAALTRTWSEYRSETDGVPDKQQFINQLYPKP